MGKLTKFARDALVKGICFDNISLNKLQCAFLSLAYYNDHFVPFSL